MKNILSACCALVVALAKSEGIDGNADFEAELDWSADKVTLDYSKKIKIEPSVYPDFSVDSLASAVHILESAMQAEEADFAEKGWGTRLLKDSVLVGPVKPLQYKGKLSNRGFIGGSLIWNPTGVGSQLSAGTKVGVRLGKLEKRQVSVTDLSNLSTEPAVDDTNYWVDKSTEDNMGVAEAKPTAALFGGTLRDEEFYTDLPKKAVFGYLSF